jgi:thiol-disulfide isomerase/thioredoxin
MTAGLIALAAALAVATAAGLTWRQRNGRMRPVPGGRSIAGQAAAGEGAIGERSVGEAADGETAAGRAAAGQATAGQSAAGQAAAGQAATGRPVAGQAARRRRPAKGAAPDLTGAELGGPLGSRATLLQFSSAFCAPCRATRRVLAEVAGMTDGVAHLEIDAESHLELVRRLDVRRTPTVFVLGPDGRIAHRASGQPRKADVIAALGEVT